MTDSDKTLRRSEPAPSERDRAFGKFTLVEVLGRGGWGEVWKAWEPGLGRHVALKLLHGAIEPEDRQRFLREAQVAGRLSHPAIVPVFEQGRIDDTDYIAMGLIDGQPLSKLRFEPREAVRIIRDAARAVHAAHDVGVIHRDLKPANLMIENKTGRVFVLDFGLARQVREGSSISLSGMVIGTPAYMAPEQAQGHVHVDARTDVYGLGAALYELVTGRTPFLGRDLLDVLHKVVNEEPESPRRVNPGLQREIEIIISKALDKEPARRYASADALAEDLDRHLRGDPISARPASWTYRVVRRVQKHPLAYALGALLVAAAGLAVHQIVQRHAAAAAHLRDLEEIRALDADMERVREYVRTAESLESEATFDRPRRDRLLADAERLCRAAEARRPAYAAAAYEGGRVEMTRRKWDDAVARFDKAAARGHPRAPYLRAVSRIEKMFDLEASIALGHENTNFAAAQQALFDAAAADLDGLPESELDPEQRTEWALLRCFIAHDWAAIDRISADLAARNEVNWRFWRLIAESQHRRAQSAAFKVALKTYRQLALGRRSAAWIWLRIAHLQFDLKDDGGHRDALGHALRIDPDNARAHLLMAEVMLRMGDRDEALTHLDDVERLDPALAGPSFYRATAFLAAHRFAEAEEAATRDLALGGRVENHNVRAVARNQLEKFEGAAADLDAFLAVHPDELDSVLSRGVARQKLGRFADAEADYLRALKIAPADWPNRAYTEQHLRETRRAIEDGREF